MKRILLLLLALTLLSGCGKIKEDAPHDPLEELREYYGAEITEDIPPLTTFTLPYRSSETWDPITCSDGVQQTLAALVYEPLFALDETFTPHGVLISATAYDAETFTYTFTLRSGLRFSDGTELTAQDISATLLRAADSPRYAARLYQLDTVRSEGNTVVVTLKEDNRAFPALLDMAVIRYGTENDLIPIGSGPYVPSADLTSLQRNSNYQQHTSLPFTEIALRPYKSEEAAAYAFTSHDVHLFVCNHLSDGDLLPTSHHAANTDAETTLMHYLGLNMDRHVLAEPTVRQAVSLAIDRHEIASSALSGHATATQFAVNPASALYPADLERAFSIAGARKLLHTEEDASQTQSEEIDPIPLRLIVNSENPFKVSAAGNVAAALNRCGFQVSVDTLSWEDFLYALETGHYDLYYASCKLSSDWDLSALLGTESPLNYGNYTNPDTELLMDVLAGADERDRPEAMKALCRHLQKEVPLIPLFFEHSSVLLPQNAVEQITPTATNPFFGLEQWQVHWGEELPTE